MPWPSGFRQFAGNIIRCPPLTEITVAAQKSVAARIVRFRRCGLNNSELDSNENVKLKSSVKIPQKRQARSRCQCVAFAKDAKNSAILKATNTVSPLKINRRLEQSVFIMYTPAPRYIDTMAGSQQIKDRASAV
jgi:hypothetical protein